MLKQTQYIVLKLMEFNKMKILDCTLRDGGYYNNWDFSEEIVEEYLNSMANANIDFVELGLRNFPKSGFVGAFAYTTENFLNSLDLPEGPEYGVMVDAKTILGSELSVEDAINSLFTSSEKSKIKLVRVAAHFHEVECSGEIVEHLKSLGYIVGFNLMQAGGKPCAVISEKAKIAKSWNGLDVLYFADSLGNMDAEEVKRIVSAIRCEWDGELGIHTHDNMSKGLDNSLTALKSGVSWLDSTVTGMGRGAGNTQTENLLATLVTQGAKYNPAPVYELVIRSFEPMQKKYGWGSNLLYFLGAQNDIHPTFIQNLLSSSHYGTDEIVGAINYLSNLEGTSSYNGDVLDTALTFSKTSNEISGCDSLVGKFDGREVLLIANGPSCKTYKKAIEEYIKSYEPVVISININSYISEELIDYFIITHNSKALSEFDQYSSLESPIILPKHRFSEQELANLSKVTIIDYGIQVEKGEFEIHDSFALIPYDLTVPYALSALVISGTNCIKLIGFDGFDSHDERQREMNEVLEMFKHKTPNLKIESLTPTTYNVDKGSIYAPIF